MLALLLAVTLVGAGCGGDDSGGEASSVDASDEPADDQSADADDEAQDADEEAEPEGQVLLEEDFEDDDDPNLWGPVSDDGLSAAIEDGAMTFGFDQDPFEYFGLPEDSGIPILAQWPSALDGVAPELTDTQLTTTVEFGFGGAAGLMCRIADPAGQEDFSSYQAEVLSTGYVAVYRADDDGLDAPVRLLRVPAEDEDAEEEDEDAPPTLPEETAFEFEEGHAYEIGSAASTPTRAWSSPSPSTAKRSAAWWTPTTPSRAGPSACCTRVRRPRWPPWTSTSRSR
jgi:hypothetical protein